MPPAATPEQMKNVLASLDPSPRTMEQLVTATSALKELMEEKLKGVDQQFVAMQTAVKLLQDSANRSPTISEISVKHAEKFEAVKEKFDLLGKQTDKIAELNQKAIDAALQAAEKAVGKQNETGNAAIKKSEDSTNKTLSMLDEKINDIKERADRREGQASVIDPSIAFALSEMSKEIKSLQAGPGHQSKDSNSLLLALFGFGLIVAIGLGIAGMIMAVKY